MSAVDCAASLAKVGAGDTPQEVTAGDAARAETLLPLPAAEVAGFVRATERLWRLNPHLEIRAWLPRENGFSCTAHDELGDRTFETDATVETTAERLLLHYAAGLRQSTEIRVEAAPDGSRLIITDHYPRIEDAQDPRLVEVDRTLVPWVAAIRRHLLARRRWGWLPGWRWWHERFMLRMAPRSRRIVRLLVWISVLEFAVFLGAVAVLRLAS